MEQAIRLFASKLPPPEELSRGGFAFPSAVGASDAFLAMALVQDNILAVVTPGLPDADRLYDDLALLSAKTAVRLLEFPPLIPDDKSSLGTRLKTIAALKAWELNPYPAIVVIPFVSLASPVAAGESQPLLGLSAGAKSCDLSQISAKLAEMGYRRLPMVENEGDFSVRGGILDVWSAGEEWPIRAEFFGDELESIRTFDPGTQLSTEKIETAEILPICDCGQKSERKSSILSLLPRNAGVLFLEHNTYPAGIPDGIALELKSYHTGEPPPANAKFHELQLRRLPGLGELKLEDAHHPELFDSRLRQLEKYLDAARKNSAKVFKLDNLSGGFELGDLIAVAKSDRVFAKRTSRPRKSAAHSSMRIHDFDELEGGEYVVHIDYGVGRYVGSAEIVVDSQRKEVFTIEYDGGLLHVPAAHAHLLSRYVGAHGETVKLHRLDGKSWEKDRADAQKAVSDLAAALLETQAKRQSAEGFAYDVECDGFAAFEAAFPYEETPDQAAAVAAVKKDLASSKPMDRLICGDAGYGKTEVAMRAAYIAAMNGRQVAVLAPTTVLAEQHYESFISRFDNTPVTITSLSRLHTGSARSRTLEQIACGSADIVVGTHAILSRQVRWRNLGLIIIDEEQRFGVKDKEHLKRLRENADILTLSATPIPRTLYMSMTGMRDLSLLKTPPRERVAVETHIVADSDETVRAAVEREIARGGQVYYLHNRVHSIDKAAKRLASICRDARIAIAHGQMETRSLARIMHEFEAGKYDILVSTTIVESGIDIPRANTIIVERADSFGLGELYQLRGRVGRSSRQGHAFFLLPGSGDVDSDARERLAALKRHGQLGGGFGLALRDLELRGAGNLLGREQSGHIAAIGFTLYCQLLTRTIAAMRGEKVREIVDTKLNLDFSSARIPYGYIEEDALRFSMLKRFAEAQTIEGVRRLSREMTDRFGPQPECVREFVRTVELKVLSANCGIGRIDVKEKRAVFYRNGSRDIAEVASLAGKNAKAKLEELVRFVRQLAGKPS